MFLAITRASFVVFFVALYLILLTYASSLVLLLIKVTYASCFCLAFSFTSSFHHEAPFILRLSPLDVPKIFLVDLLMHSTITSHIWSTSSTGLQLPSTLTFSDNFAAFSLVRFHYLTLGSPIPLFFLIQLLIDFHIYHQ